MELFLGEYIDVVDVNRIRCQHYLGNLISLVLIDEFMCGSLRNVLKRVSFGSKNCIKELKLECAYFLGQTS